MGDLPVVQVAAGRPVAGIGWDGPAGSSPPGRHCHGPGAIGGVAIGLFSVGGVAIGLVAVGAVAIGPVALGAVSVGLVAVGAVAIGLTAMGASRPVLSLGPRLPGEIAPSENLRAEDDRPGGVG